MAIAGALERKVWVKVGRRILYPSQYVLLVGPPGVGKTDALRNVLELWDELPTLRVAPNSVTRASLTDELKKAERNILRPTDAVPYKVFNSLQACPTEFGTFLTTYDGEFMSSLNDLYDCIRYRESKRHLKEPIEINNPQLNLLSATTPAWLSSTLPVTAWAEGFSSRLMMIFSGERQLVADLFLEDAIDDAVRSALVHDLKRIHEAYGEMSITKEFHEAYLAWYHRGGPPIPEHPKLEHYLPRRHIHLLKLAMCHSLSSREDLVLRIEDYQAAMEMFIEAEEQIPEIFKAMKHSPEANVMDETYNYVAATYQKEQRPVSEHRIVHFIGQRAPTYTVTKILEHLVASNILKIVDFAGPGGRARYMPSPRQEHGTEPETTPA